MTHPTDVDVLIVGAGPTGLTLACLLAQFGVKFRIIEKNHTITERSKAIAVQARTLELFEQLGVSEKAVEQGHPAEGLDLVARGKIRASIDIREYGRGLTKYPYMLVLEQSKTERLLLDKLESFGKKVEWKTELVELAQHPDYVAVATAGGDKIETIRAKYLVAADGARSTVRTFLHLPFVGGTYESRFLLADVQVQGHVSRRHISLCFSRQGFAGFFPMYGSDRFRAISLLTEAIGEKLEGDFEIIADEIQKQAQLPLSISDPRWFATYKLHHRSVVHFKEQRCFFAGDAAHIHSPAGGQGMNTGIQDVFNLAWKLSYVLAGRAQEKLLETYHEERFPVAQKLIRTTDQIFSFATDRRAFFRWWRLYLVPPLVRLASKLNFVRKFVFKLISQTGVDYHGSSLTHQCFSSKGVLRAGDRFCLSGSQDGLFHAFLVGGQEAQKHAIEVLEKFFENKVKLYTLDKRPDLQSILQSFGIFKDGLILVRPDGYVCFCADSLDMNLLLKYLNRFYLLKGARQDKRSDRKEAFPFESFI